MSVLNEMKLLAYDYLGIPMGTLNEREILFYDYILDGNLGSQANSRIVAWARVNRNTGTVIASDGFSSITFPGGTGDFVCAFSAERADNNYLPVIVAVYPNNGGAANTVSYYNKSTTSFGVALGTVTSGGPTLALSADCIVYVLEAI